MCVSTLKLELEATVTLQKPNVVADFPTKMQVTDRNVSLRKSK